MACIGIRLLLAQHIVIYYVYVKCSACHGMIG
jgi:hypothetical protein